MASVNKVILIGNVGSEPEMRFTPSGKSVANFNLATNRKYTNGEGEQQEETTWFSITVWGKQAEVVNQYVSKGMQVYVEGGIKLHEWDGQDGTKHARLDVTANNVIFLSPKKQDAAGGGNAEPEDLPF